MPVPGLWVPPGADPNVEMRAQVDAERRQLASEQMHQLLEHTRRMNRELQRIDPYLELVWVSAHAPNDDPAVKPGRWHVVRRNPGAPDTWMPVTGADGCYVEPTSRVFDKLAEGDMWRDEYGQRARKRQAKAAADKQRNRDSERERLREELVERYKAATQVRISFSPDHAWTQNMGAGARRDAGQRRKERQPA